MKWIIFFMIILIILLVSLRIWRYFDERELNRVWRTLVSETEEAPPAFNKSMVAELPQPARQFFEAAIDEGTPLHRAAEITMHGVFSLGNKDAPAYKPMSACQLLAAPRGFIWDTRVGNGLTQVVGSDAAYPTKSWLRFWLAGLIPVARSGNTHDHLLSSFGRYMSEAILWTPAALLPSPDVHWEAVKENTARVTVTEDNMTQSFDIVIDSAGRPREIRFQRWTNANATKTYQQQPFGGYLSDFKKFEGFWLPTTVVAGNNFGTDAYYPFFKASVAKVEFIKRTDQARNCRSL